MNYRGVRWRLCICVLLFSLAGCRERQADPFVTDEEVNNWIYDEMKTWYYWTGKIPGRPDFSQQPEDFFNSLLYTYNPTLRPDGDRFSWIQQSAEELKSSLSGETTTTGIEYSIFTGSGTSDVFGVILYVLKGSPAALAGLKRGDFITSVNGNRLTAANYRSLMGGSGEKKLTLGELDEEKNVVQGTREITVVPLKLQEDPVYFDTVFVIHDRKIGYVVYHQFFPSSNGSEDKAFDKKMDKVFAGFKAAGISELIVDLRYNPGGYVSSAVNLASLIARGVSDKSVFSIKEYNPEITKVLKKRYGDEYFEDRFATKAESAGALLQRVFVLTSRRTASASELLVNGLKPYMTVVVTGGQTVGKNVGSVTLSDEKKRTNWGMQPIVSKSFNSLKQSDYTAGFIPDIQVSEGYVLYPYGDLRDPLLGAAVESITGVSAAARTGAGQEPSAILPVEIGSSIEAKAGGSSMFEKIP